MLDRLPPDRRRAVDALGEELIREEYTLRDLRQRLHLSQADVARQMGVTQVAVSKLEARTDPLVSTVRHYIEALGGSVEILVTLPGQPPVKLAIGDMEALVSK